MDPSSRTRERPPPVLILRALCYINIIVTYFKCRQFDWKLLRLHINDFTRLSKIIFTKVGKPAYLFHTRLPVLSDLPRTNSSRRNVVFKVAVRETDEPPGQRENQPTKHKGKDKVQQVPAPFDVDQSRENVGHVALTTFLDVGARDVTLAVLKDKTLVRSSDTRCVVAATALLELSQSPQVAGTVQHTVRDRCPALVAWRQEVGRHGSDHSGRAGRLRGSEGRQDSPRTADDDWRRRTVEE